jgi:type II protein arginine methyltransferase
MRVLEIGTGSGVLAMMAARAGAAEVLTREINPIVAETARANIARNGYADRVRVIDKHSDKLDVQHDLGERMDLPVSEIVGNDLLCENILPAQERAVRDLLKPGAPVIPARGVSRWWKIHWRSMRPSERSTASISRLWRTGERPS